MSLVSNTDLATPLTDDQARRAEQLNPLLRRTVALRRIAQLEANLNTLTADQALEQFSQVPFNELPYSNVPTDTNTVTIGADVYEFVTAAGDVASDTNIGVVIGTSNVTAQNLVDAINATLGSGPVHPTLFQTDGVTPAVASGTENVLAVYVAGTVYVYNADAPGGNKVDGVAPSLAFTESADNYGPWMYSNLNLSIGAGYAPTTKVAHIKHTVIAGDLTETMPLRIPVPFAPQSYALQVRDAQGVLRDSYVEVTVPAAVGTQNFVGLNLADTTPTVVRKQPVTVPVVPAQATKRVELVIPVNPPKVKEITIPIADNDVSVQTWYPSATISISNITFSRGEAAGSTLVASLDKVTAATAADTVSLATNVDIAAGTSGAVQTFTPDEAGGSLPIAVTVNEALIFTVTAGNGTVAPRSVTFWVTYSEAGAAASASWNPPVASTISAYKFIRSEDAVGTLVMNLDKITKSSGAVAAALASAVSVAGGTNNVEQTFTADDSAPPTAIAATEGVKATVVAGPGTTAKTVTLVIEYTETSAESGKGVAHWFPGKACLITGFTTTLGETHVGSTLTMNTDVITASTGAVATQLGTLVSVVGTKDLETAHTPDEAGWGAGPLALTALQGLRFETVADATTKAPQSVTVHVKYVEQVVATDVLILDVFGA